MAEERIRTFVAVELPEDVKIELTQIQKRLADEVRQGVRWARPEGLHLTLKFLGNVAVSLLPGIAEAIAAGCAGVRPFSLTLSDLGVFPNRKRPRVIWVGVAGDLVKLVELQGKVDREIQKLGFAGEDRPFSPHLTLGRLDETAPASARQQVGELLDVVRIPAGLSIEVASVSLMQSKLARGGAVYSRLASIDL